MMKPLFLLAGVGMLTAATTAPPQTPTDISIFAEEGRLVPRTSDKSMPIYTFDNDRGGASTCYDKCAERWPPVLATPHLKPIGDFTLVVRRGGLSQWAYKGKPLYTFADDDSPQPKGDGVGKVWHVLGSVPPIEVK